MKFQIHALRYLVSICIYIISKKQELNKSKHQASWPL